jgi:phosphoglycerate dehydrogenase-like enzyme
VSARVAISHEDPAALAGQVSALLGEPVPWAEAGAPEAAGAEVWFCATGPPERTVELPALRWIQSGWAGVETWFSRSEWRPGVLLTRTVGDFPQRISEYVLGYLLAQELGVVRALRQMESRVWSRWRPASLAGRRLLIVGYGETGRALAGIGRAFQMEVAGIRRGPVSGAEREAGVSDPGGLDRELARASVVVNLLPHTPATESFWTAARFSAMGEGVTFVQVSRGATVDEGALLEGVGRGRPARAILDVFREEPLPPSHPLRSRPEIWITPHVAGIGTVETLAREFAENWTRYRSGQPLRRLVDRERGY